MIFRSYANVYQRVTSLILQRPEVSPGPLGALPKAFSELTSINHEAYGQVLHWLWLGIHLMNG